MQQFAKGDADPFGGRGGGRMGGIAGMIPEDDFAPEYE